MNVDTPRAEPKPLPPPPPSDPTQLEAARLVLRGAVSTHAEPLPDLEPVDPHTMAVRQLLVGVALVVIGVVITAATYTTARNDGDRYLLAFGPIVIGAIAMVRGFVGLFRD